ncbi:hypothetical protein ASD52_32075 [Ensifer sp. Root142]|nr:hypothetical protein ASD00_34460 [Ensifer sp. Root31]KQY69476.1 hypothetical protein ASD52_32075 [Ensifer sp. Root142]
MCCLQSVRNQNQSLTRPDQRPGDIEDVVASGCRIILAPGDPRPDAEVDTAHLPEVQIAVG